MRSFKIYETFIGKFWIFYFLGSSESQSTASSSSTHQATGLISANIFILAWGTFRASLTKPAKTYLCFTYLRVNLLNHRPFVIITIRENPIKIFNNSTTMNAEYFDKLIMLWTALNFKQNFTNAIFLYCISNIPAQMEHWRLLFP